MRSWRVQDGQACEHAAGMSADVPPAAECEDCVKEGSSWVHLRRCLTCQHVGCCNSSPRQHATAHWRATDHPVMASAEPGDRWAWCFPDELTLVPAR
jgi:hypothetical protein